MKICISDGDDELLYKVQEINVSVGDKIKKEDILLVVESDKAAVDVMASNDGIVRSLLVHIGSEVSGTTTLIELELKVEPNQNKFEKPVINNDVGSSELHTDVVVIGAGPGGYSAAFRSSDLGANTILVDKNVSLGGTCLNVGCIPSKALLHAAKVMKEVEHSSKLGISFKNVVINIQKLRNWKQEIVNQLTNGIKYLANKRSIKVLNGHAKFTSKESIEVATSEEVIKVFFKKAIIATGSHPLQHPLFDYGNERVMSSDDALDIRDIPDRLLVIGCGVIGMELASVYQALGSKVTLLEYTNSILFGIDRDLTSIYEKENIGKYESVYVNSEVTDVKYRDDGMVVEFKEGDKPNIEYADKVLVAIGRKPFTSALELESIGIKFTDNGFISVDKNNQSSVPNIFAIGDVVDGPMLAHKAVYEGKKVAEFCIEGYKSNLASSIPAVVYTDPEIAWVGITEDVALHSGTDYKVGKVNWNVNGRLLCHGQKYGLTKMLVNPDSNKIIGAGIVGPNAGELIAELTLAIDLGLTPFDLSNTIHPHPTFSETTLIAAEDYLGIATDVIS